MVVWKHGDIYLKEKIIMNYLKLCFVNDDYAINLKNLYCEWITYIQPRFIFHIYSFYNDVML